MLLAGRDRRVRAIAGKEGRPSWDLRAAPVLLTADAVRERILTPIISSRRRGWG